MTIGNHLQQFYSTYGIPKNGGSDNPSFDIKVFGINFKLPNPKFRRKVLYVHDVEHVLNECDTSWKGEGYIAGWEIATGMWKHFPVGFISLWAFAYTLWLHPTSVFKGYKKGLDQIGIIDLDISKTDLMNMELHELKGLTRKPEQSPGNQSNRLSFGLWVVLSQGMFLAPLIGLAVLYLLFK